VSPAGNVPTYCRMSSPLPNHYSDYTVTATQIATQTRVTGGNNLKCVKCVCVLVWCCVCGVSSLT
jgi:hypothetical protein